jgi:hypothetical protein
MSVFNFHNDSIQEWLSVASAHKMKKERVFFLSCSARKDIRAGLVDTRTAREEVQGEECRAVLSLVCWVGEKKD